MKGIGMLTKEDNSETYSKNSDTQKNASLQKQATHTYERLCECE